MTEHVTLTELNAWTDGTKGSITKIDDIWEAQISGQVLAAIANIGDVSTWVDSSSTPILVKQIICMKYVGWYYDRAYADDEDLNPYAEKLLPNADNLIQGILSGSLILPELPVGSNTLGNPVFYPNDASSMQEPNCYDTSLGDSKFSMGRTW